MSALSISPRPVRASRRPLLLVVLATAAVLAAAVAVLTPRDAPRGTSLASSEAGPRGALGLYAALGRLGWRPERDSTPLARTPAAAVYVAVRADHGVYDTVAARVLAAVRDGAGLVVDVRPGDPLSDSLGLVLDAQAAVGVAPIDNRAAAAALGVDDALGRAGCRRRRVEDVESGARYASYALADSGEAAAGRPGRRVFLDVAAGGPLAGGPSGGRRVPVVVGFAHGRGRVVALADAAVLTNAAVRACWAAAGPVAVRAFEWVSEGVPAAPGSASGGRPRVVFFEGVRAPEQAPAGPSVLRAVRRALVEAPAGRVVTQLVAAALVLLAAAAVRALPPEPSPRVARRSPLEHVGALARAYREARASRVAARRLAAGLRRRYGSGTGAGAGASPAAPEAAAPDAAVPADADARFLAGVAARHPARAEDAARLSAALAEPVPPGEVVEVGAAAARIARALDAARRGATA